MPPRLPLLWFWTTWCTVAMLSQSADRIPCSCVCFICGQSCELQSGVCLSWQVIIDGHATMGIVTRTFITERCRFCSLFIHSVIKTYSTKVHVRYHLANPPGGGDFHIKGMGRLLYLLGVTKAILVPRGVFSLIRSTVGVFGVLFKVLRNMTGDIWFYFLFQNSHPREANRTRVWILDKLSCNPRANVSNVLANQSARFVKVRISTCTSQEWKIFQATPTK